MNQLGVHLQKQAFSPLHSLHICIIWLTWALAFMQDAISMDPLLLPQQHVPGAPGPHAGPAYAMPTTAAGAGGGAAMQQQMPQDTRQQNTSTQLLIKSLEVSYQPVVVSVTAAVKQHSEISTNILATVTDEEECSLYTCICGHATQRLCRNGCQ